MNPKYQAVLKALMPVLKLMASAAFAAGLNYAARHINEFGLTPAQATIVAAVISTLTAHCLPPPHKD